MFVGSVVDQLSLELWFYQLQAVVLRLVMLVVVGFRRKVVSVGVREVLVLYLFVLVMNLQLIFVYVKVRRL